MASIGKTGRFGDTYGMMVLPDPAKKSGKRKESRYNGKLEVDAKATKHATKRTRTRAQHLHYKSEGTRRTTLADDHKDNKHGVEQTKTKQNKTKTKTHTNS